MCGGGAENFLMTVNFEVRELIHAGACTKCMIFVFHFYPEANRLFVGASFSVIPHKINAHKDAADHPPYPARVTIKCMMMERVVLYWHVP